MEKMESYWALVLFVGVVVASSPTASPGASQEQVITAAINMINQQDDLDFLFRLQEYEPQPDWQTTPGITQPLRFSIKETTCLASEKRDIKQCDFKNDGVDQDCSGFYSTQQTPPSIIVQCEDIDQEMKRITRGRWSRFKNKLKRWGKKYGPSVVLGALRFG